jgi:hypothetical protein
LGAWFLGGPLQPGWAARAGTPPQLLAHTSSVVSSSPSKVATVEAPIVLPSQASGQGITRRHLLTGNGARIVVSLRTQGSPALAFRVVLNGQQIPQGVSMSNGSVVLTPPGGAAAYQGSVTGLSGGEISADLSDGHGDRVALTLALQISSTGQTTAQVAIQPLATGSVHA